MYILYGKKHLGQNCGDGGFAFACAFALAPVLVSKRSFLYITIVVLHGCSDSLLPGAGARPAMVDGRLTGVPGVGCQGAVDWRILRSSCTGICSFTCFSPFSKTTRLECAQPGHFFIPQFIGGLAFVWPYMRSFDQWMQNFGSPNNSPVWIFAGVVFYTGVPLVCLAVFGGVGGLLEKQRSALYFLLGATLPVLMMMGIALFHYSANRYAFVSLTSWVILGSMAVCLLFETSSRPGRWAAWGVLVLVAGSMLVDTGMYFLFQNGNREDWKGALAFIQSSREPSEHIVMTEPEIGQIYLKEATKDFSQVNFNEIEQQDQTIWFIEDLDAQNLFPDQLSWVHEKASLKGVFDVTIQGRQYPMRVYEFTPANQTDHK